MSKLSFRILLGVTTALGICVGYELAGIQSLQSYKLVNIVGLLLSLLAVFVLSEVLVSNPGWKNFCVELIAPTLLWSTITVPIGMALGAGIAWLVGRSHSGSVVGPFAFGAYVYGSFLGTVLEQAVVLPRMLTVLLPRFFAKDIETFKGVRSARLVVAFDGTGLEIWPVGLIRICGEEQEKPGN